MFLHIATCLVTFLLSALALALPAADPVRPPSGAVAVNSLTVETEGSGCRPGAVSVAIASDNSAITLIFDKFQAADGPNTSGTSVKTRAFCRISIGMSSPGWAFDITSADFRGYVSLDKGVEASLVSRWKWIDASGADMKGKGNIHKIVDGPFANDVLLHKDGELSDTEATVCQKKDAKLQISLSATVDSGTSKGNGIVQGNSQDFSFKEIVNLSWKKCS